MRNKGWTKLSFVSHPISRTEGKGPIFRSKQLAPWPLPEARLENQDFWDEGFSNIKKEMNGPGLDYSSFANVKNPFKLAPPPPHFLYWLISSCLDLLISSTFKFTIYFNNNWLTWFLYWPRRPRKCFSNLLLICSMMIVFVCWNGALAFKVNEMGANKSLWNSLLAWQPGG